MENVSVGKRLFLIVLSLFILFAALFIVFQQAREKEFKISMLNMKLQDYNARMDEALSYIGNHSEQTLSKYVKLHSIPDLRVTLIHPDGTVFFDNEKKDYAHIKNHSNRDEIREALKNGSGYDINRSSSTLKGNYFYSATYFKEDSIIIRSALPYNNDLSKSLQADQHYLWFTLIVVIILSLVLYRFVQRLGSNITMLRIFASRADRNESLETEDLAAFPSDELGEISEHIIKIYKRLQKTKEEQNILKRQLTQNVAHELKTPVSSIQGYLETIIDNKNLTEEQKEQFLQRCYAQSQRLTSLLRDISTLNRLDDAPELVDFEEVDISQIVSNIEKEVALQLQEHNMTIQNGLPSTLTVNGNQSLIYSVFRNLTDNAIAYAGESTTITIEEIQSGNADMIAFRFSDNGIGVGREHLLRLFERFYRVDKGRSRKLGGTGLGLAIVKNAILLHGGTIRAYNNEDGGLSFEFTLKK
jgi:signal transduction histidine kinase